MLLISVNTLAAFLFGYSSKPYTVPPPVIPQAKITKLEGMLIDIRVSEAYYGGRQDQRVLDEKEYIQMFLDAPLKPMTNFRCPSLPYANYYK